MFSNGYCNLLEEDYFTDEEVLSAKENNHESSFAQNFEPIASKAPSISQEDAEIKLGVTFRSFSDANLRLKYEALPPDFDEAKIVRDPEELQQILRNDSLLDYGSLVT